MVSYYSAQIVFLGVEPLYLCGNEGFLFKIIMFFRFSVC